jgi:hypothetical protein
MQTRPMKHLAKILAKERHSMSFPELAKKYHITTPTGKPNPGMVKKIIDGYQPKRTDTLNRCPIPPMRETEIVEPTRRVLSGAWRLGSNWVSPEDYFHA